MNPTTNRPTIATLLTAFAVSVLSALVDLIPASVPAGLVGSGYTFAVAVAAVAIGKAAQGQLFGGWLSETAPWSAPAHEEAVRQAKTGHVVWTSTDPK